jgi:hypothetical protein
MPGVHHFSTRSFTSITLSITAFTAFLSACFNSDSLLYDFCEPGAGECEPAGSEPKGTITRRGCFTPNGMEARGYCVPYCKDASEDRCDASIAPSPRGGGQSSVECLLVNDSITSSTQHEACVITCTTDDDCPNRMECVDYAGPERTFRACSPQPGE